MSQALKDLPDPLQPAPALPTSNPDDLLAKMADEAIDQLMADADRGATPKATPPVVDHDDAPPTAEPDEGGEADELPDLNRPPAKAEAAVVPPAAIAAPVAAIDAPPVTSAVADVAPAAVATTEPTPSPDAAVKALLSEEPPAHPSPLLWPLRILNAPIAGLGDRGRLLVGLLGVITLVPAAAAIVWVLYLKR